MTTKLHPASSTLPGQNLGKARGLSYTYLHVTSGILRRYGDSILGSNDSNLGQNSIADSLFDLLDLLDGLLLVQAVEEEVDVRGGAELFMVVFTELCARLIS